MSCSEMLDLIADSPLDLLTPASRAALDAHLVACADCRAALAALEGCLSAALPEAVPPAQGWERLAARIATERGLAVRVVLSCSYCKDALSRGEACYCAACLAPHHRDCFAEHGRCSAPGCDETRMVEAGVPRPAARPARPALWVCLGVALAGAAALIGNELRGREPGAPVAVATPTAPSPPPPPPVKEPVAVVASAAEPAPIEDTFPLIEARVVAIKTDVDPALLLLSVGRDDGVEQGCAFWIYRDGQLLGRAVAEKVLADSTGCRLVGFTQGMPVQIGDQATTRLRLGVTRHDSGRITLHYTDADVRSVLTEVGAAVGVEVVIDPTFQGKATLRVSDVSWLQAATAVAKTVGDFEIVVAPDGRSLRVVPRPGSREKILEVAIDEGVEAYRLKEYRAAIAACDRAQRIDPRSPRPWTLRGHVHWSLGELDAAEAAYDKALELSPEHVPALHYRAQLRIALEDWKGAVADAARASELAPTDERVKETLERARARSELMELLSRELGKGGEGRADPAPVGSPAKR